MQNARGQRRKGVVTSRMHAHAGATTARPIQGLQASLQGRESVRSRRNVLHMFLCTPAPGGSQARRLPRLEEGAEAWDLQQGRLPTGTHEGPTDSDSDGGAVRQLQRRLRVTLAQHSVTGGGETGASLGGSHQSCAARKRNAPLSPGGELKASLAARLGQAWPRTGSSGPACRKRRSGSSPAAAGGCR